LVHGDGAVAEAEAISSALFNGDVELLTEPQLAEACKTMPSTALTTAQADGMSVVELLTKAGLAASKREGRDLVSAGAVAINGQRVKGVETLIGREMARFGRFIIIRKGKKSYHAVTLAGSSGQDSGRMTDE